MENQELTFGEKLVGKSFNPSQDPRVDRVKELCAELADLVNNTTGVNEPVSYLFNLIKGNTLREILNAQMNTVKLLTFKN